MVPSRTITITITKTTMDALHAKVRSLKDKLKDKKRKHADKKRKHADKTEDLYDRIDRLNEENARYADKTEDLYDRIDRLKVENAYLDAEVARANKQARCAEDAVKATTRQKNEMNGRLTYAMSRFTDAHNDNLSLRRRLNDLSVECEQLRAENAEHTTFRRDLGRAIEETLSRCP